MIMARYPNRRDCADHTCVMQLILALAIMHC